MERHCYIIMYDLRAPGRNYEQLYQAIKSYGTWGKLTESSWAIVSDQTAENIRNFLFTFIDGNDRLMVIQSGKNAAWRNIRANNDWLKKNLVL
ncbi:MAG: hypothetical protein NC396_05710 [Bacteroides sp.]|nr:hypothetical protein [Bacteroides sp.]MCM1085851.1 hypothetical protein [Bacteroides sp.]